MDLVASAKFLETVLNKQYGKYLAFSRKYRGKWRDVFFQSVPEAVEWLKTQPDDADLYFCPTRFAKPRRIKDNVQPSFFLWSDLDEADPHIFPAHFKPTYAWESSPGRFQALWELDRAASPHYVEEKNKGLAYKLGADRGGWDLTQVLRIPGTLNNKYASRPEVRLLWHDKSVIRSLHEYPSVEITVSETLPGAPNVALVRSIVRRYGKELSPQTKGFLLKSTPPRDDEDRSKIYWSCLIEMVTARIPKSDVLRAIQASVWNKYRGRSNETDMHESQYIKAVAQVHEEEIRLEGRQKKVYKVESLYELMTRKEEDTPWLIEGFWNLNSHGIIGGEPKSLKTYIALEMALSVAMDRPFCGEYDVKKPGPVLFIQEETSRREIIKRVSRICSGKGLFWVKREDRTPQSNAQVMLPSPKDPLHFINLQRFNLQDESAREELHRHMDIIRPRLLVIDPLYLVFSDDMNRVDRLHDSLSYLIQLKETYDTSIVVIHHLGKNLERSPEQRLMGSTMLRAWAETGWYLTVEETNPGNLILGLSCEFREEERQSFYVNINMENDSFSAEIEKRGAPPKLTDDEAHKIIHDTLKSLGASPVSKIRKNVPISYKRLKVFLGKMVRQGTLRVDGTKYLLAD